MTAEQMTVSLVKRLSCTAPLKKQEGYYRSKLFIAPISANPLVAAAGPLFSLLERLSISTSLPAFDSIFDNIHHELLAFHSRLSSKVYSQELEALAHYLLTATIDEFLSRSYARLYHQKTEFKPFAPQTTDDLGPAHRFFDIVYFIKERPHQYLDIIELAYYCLITGFEGKYQGQTEGRFLLENLIEELYQIIQAYRVNKTHFLFKDAKPLDLQVKQYQPWILISCLALGLLIVSFSTSYTLLENKAKTLQFGHPIIERMER